MSIDDITAVMLDGLQMVTRLRGFDDQLAFNVKPGGGVVVRRPVHGVQTMSDP